MALRSILKNFMKLLLSALLVVTVLSLFSCGYKEEITPAYSAKQLKFKAIPITLNNPIDPTVIQPDPARKFIHKIIGGIPIVGDVLELPMDLVASVISFPFEDKMKLPSDGPWTDEKILPLVASARITAIHLEIVPENERGPDYEKRRCWVVFRCGETLKFLEEMYLHVAFPDPTATTKDDKGKEIPGEAHFLLASAKKEKNFDDAKELIKFETTDVDLIPLIKNYGSDFHIKIFAKGKPPKRPVYIRGGVTVEIVMQLPPVY